MEKYFPWSEEAEFADTANSPLILFDRQLKETLKEQQLRSGEKKKLG